MIISLFKFLFENEIPLKKLFVLVGPPSVGKSSWIKNTFIHDDPFIVNRDNIVERVAHNLGWTYDDMYINPPTDAKVGEIDPKYGEVLQAPSFMFWTKTVFSKVLAANDMVQKEFNAHVQEAASSNKDIVVDMTNMDPASRQRALNILSGRHDYEKIAVVFEFDGVEDIIQKVAAKRSEIAKRMGKNKTINSDVFKMMFANFKRPSESEGFDKIISVDNRELLRKLAR